MEQAMMLTENARRIMEMRYLLKDPDTGELQETPEQAVWRVAMNVAAPTAIYAFLEEGQPWGELDDSSFLDHAEWLSNNEDLVRTCERLWRWMDKKGRLVRPTWPVTEEWKLSRVVHRYELRIAEVARKYEAMMRRLEFFPNSPTWTGAGTPLGQLAACFVLPIADDLVTQRDSIFETLKVAVAIQQTGGGNGFSFSGLRPKGSSVSKSRGQASGPVGFLRTYNAAFGEVQQGGTRRGANMGVMRVSHPDIREFVAAKVVEGEIANFNISVGLTDDFMTAVELDREYLLRFGDKVYDRIRARDLWNELIRSAWELGDPGCLFLDTANRENPCPTRYTLEATNPCYSRDSLLLTDGGLIPIGDLTEGSFMVMCGDREWRSAWAWVSGYKPVFRVHLRNGNHLDLTGEHEVFVTRHKPGGRSYETKVRVQDLVPGDKVRPMLGDGAWRGCMDVDIDEAVILGMVQGDGWMSGDSVYFHNREPEFLRHLEEWASHSGRVFDHLPDGRVAIRGMRSTLEKFGFHLHFRGDEWRTAILPERGLPTSLMRQSPDVVRGFLRGLFSANGNALAQHNRVCLKTTCRDMAVGVQHLLLALGFNAYITKTEPVEVQWDNGVYLSREAFGVNVCGHDAYRRFQDEIGFVHSHKQMDGAPLGSYRYSVPRVTDVVSVDPLGQQVVYDFNVMDDDPSSDTHSGWVNGFKVTQCGEQFLPPYSNCCLGSLAVHRFVKTTDTGPAFDFDRYRDAVVLATEFLDDVVDANRYVDVVPELEEAAMGERRIGLGIMGLADLLMMLGLPYDSDEGRGFAQYLMEFTRLWTMHTSAKRAKERGCFEWFGDSIYAPDGGWEPKADFLIWSGDFSSEISWPVVQEMIRQDGIRNACQLTIAPTGTISNVTGCEGSGCEPLFALTYVRKVMQEGMNVELSYGSQLFVEALTEAGMTGDEVERIVSEVAANGGSCQGLDSVPEHIQRVFKVAGDISPIDHVKMQAALQVSVDNSISKTINMPNLATPDDVAAVYRLAYDLGCKGITIYRQGSRVLEVLSTAKAEKDEDKVDPVEEERKPHQWAYVSPRSIPDYAVTYGLEAKVFPIATSFGKLHVTVTHLASHPDRPFDVRLQLGKAGNDKLADVEAIGRMISLALRAGVPVDEVVDQLEYIGGSTVHGWGEVKVRSVADAVAKLLKRLYVEDMASDYAEEDVRAKPLTASALVEHDTKMTCPNCGQATIVMESGCLHCETRLGGCGIYSACD